MTGRDWAVAARDTRRAHRPPPTTSRTTSPTLLVRRGSLVDLQRSAGNRAVCELLGAAHPKVGVVLQRDARGGPPGGAACPARPGDERARSQAPGGILAVDAVFVEANRTIEIADFPVDSATLPTEVLSSPAWERVMSLIVGPRTAGVAVTGYTDCVGAGAAAEDFALRQKRVDALMAVLPPAVRARVLISRPEVAGTYLGPNATAEGRARNRAVKLSYTSDNTRANPGEVVPKANNLDEYLYLVRSLERRLNLTAAADAPTALSVLRQIYYGSADWSAHREEIWDRVITARPWSPGTDPTAALGAPLIKALKASQVVEGADVGHTLTGLDAMMKPGIANLPGPLTSTIQNEALATWSGDLGSAAAEWAGDLYQVTGKGDGELHFKAWAGEADLLGNIDAFALRAGFNTGRPPTGQVGQALNLKGPLSAAMLDYYRTTSTTLGQARRNRFRSFAEAFGGRVDGGRITNRAVLEAALTPQVREFTIKKVQYKLYKGMTPGQNPPDIYQAMERAWTFMTRRYVDWLEARLASASSP